MIVIVVVERSVLPGRNVVVSGWNLAKLVVAAVVDVEVIVMLVIVARFPVPLHSRRPVVVVLKAFL